MNKIYLLRLLGGKTRLAIITVLTSGPKIVTEIADKVNQTHSATSHQLGLLKMAGIVTTKREGREVRYSLSNTRAGKLAAKIVSL